MLAAAKRSQLFHAGDLGRKTHAARALDAARHHRLDQRTEILVLHRALGFVIATAAEAIGHGLVLQIAFAALIADRAIQRMVDQQEFHHAVARLAHHGRVGMDHHVIGGRHSAGGDRLRRLFLFHQAHAAIAGDRQPLVIAEARNLGAGQLAGLQHGGAHRHFDRLAVDGEFRHGPSPTPPPCCRHAPQCGARSRAEMADQSLDRPGRGIAQRADRVALDLAGDLLQHVDFLDPRLAAHQALHDAIHPARALAAGRALAAALMHVEVREAADRLDHDRSSCP